MDVREAITLAKAYVAEVFADERAQNVGLEEVEYDDHGDAWNVTIGFSRPWDFPMTLGVASAFSTSRNAIRRTYKTVRISDQDGKILSVKNREVERV